MSTVAQSAQFPLAEEYRKKTLITPADISKLRDWLMTQPHLPAEYITDLDLILAFHCCERSAEVTKQLVDLNFTLKTFFQQIFKDRVVERRVEDAFKVTVFLGLPKRSLDGFAAFYGRLIDSDTKPFIFQDSIRSCLMMLDLWQYEEGTWPGLLLVFDMGGITLGHLAKLDLTTIQQFVYFLQEGLLLRLKGLHFINAPSFMDRFLMLVKPFMKKHLLDMMVIHQMGATTLEKYYPMSGLPKEAGGDYLTLQEAAARQLARLRANKKFFIEENKKRVVEARRPGKPKTITDIFGGVEGSFKKLDID